MRRNLLRDRKIGIVEAGRMGNLIAARLLDRKIFPKKDVLVTGPRTFLLTELEEKGAQIREDIGGIIEECDILLLAVKPKDIEGVCSQIASRGKVDQTIISTATAVDIEKLTKMLAPVYRIVRVIPNINSLVDGGFSAITGNCSYEKRIAKTIFSSIGKCAIVKEDEMDVIAAINGIVPAFISKIAGVLEEFASISQSMDSRVARLMIAQTILGSGETLLETGMHPKTLARLVELLEIGDIETTDTSMIQKTRTVIGLETMDRVDILEAFRKVVEETFERTKQLRHETQQNLKSG